LNAQKLETQTPDPKRVVRVETARDHLTVIELNEPVSMVAVGNQNAFTVERRENKVFVKPAEEDARTNMFIWTASGRFSYELVPAPSVGQMHFAIDQPPLQLVSTNIHPKEPTPADRGPRLPAEMLTQSQAILLYGERDRPRKVEVLLRDLYRDGDRCYLRYAVLNHGNRAYRPAQPSLMHLDPVKSSFSLIPLAGSQLSERALREIKTRTAGEAQVLAGEGPEAIPAGEQAAGWIAFRLGASGKREQLVRVAFAPDSTASVDAVLVLGKDRAVREVAHGRPAGE
ncbi:MAG: TrbG/VirB9 family P-type conjugative transfer protein, partial [Bryobacterales bacterium]|nr:TrbG/VirB9 family P-type conjugative transfer protein [Bryobacterales bacterium]